jgi:hypothetical protein
LPHNTRRGKVAEEITFAELEVGTPFVFKEEVIEIADDGAIQAERLCYKSDPLFNWLDGHKLRSFDGDTSTLEGKKVIPVYVVVDWGFNSQRE